MKQVLINKTTLTAIGDAIREKEGSSELIPVNDMASRISAIVGISGKKFTTGTVTFTTATARQTVIHNLGIIPSCIMLFPKDLSIIAESGTDEAKGKAYKFVYVHGAEGEIEFARNLQGNTSTGVIGWQGALGSSSNYEVNETTFITGASNHTYKYQANIEFEWIAIE